MRRLPWLALAALAACSTYDTRYQFEPTPVESHVQAPDGTLLAHGLAAVVGLRRADAAAGLPQAMEVRLRAENPGDRPLRLEAAAAQLFTGDLQPFLAPLAQPPGDPELPPGGSANVDLLFPLPAERGDLNLDGLSLRWSVRLDGASHSATATFARTRRPEYYYDPFYPWGHPRPIGYHYWWTRDPSYCPPSRDHRR